MTVFIRLLESDDKASDLRTAITGGAASGVYAVDVRDLSKVPSSPFCYWVSDEIRCLFDRDPSTQLAAKQGLATADDFRFSRTWYEIPVQTLGSIWIPAAKGGARSAFYRDLTAVIRWDRDGLEIRNFFNPTTGKLRSRPQNTAWFGKPGVTWPLRGIRFSAQAVPAGGLFTIAGKMAFSSTGGDRLAHLAIMNSAPYDLLMGMFAGKVGGVQYESGLIERTPLPEFDEQSRDELVDLAHSGWRAARRTDTASETSHAFVLPAAIQAGGSDLESAYECWSESLIERDEELGRVQARVDEVCLELFGISAEDRAAIGQGFGFSEIAGEDLSVGEEDDEPSASLHDPVIMAADLVSWSVGVGLGRFDIRLAATERDWPDEPDPFDPLPSRSPGMLRSDDGLPAMVPLDYPVEVSPVLVDEPGHGLDITTRVRSVFDVVFGDEADRWWSDVGEALGARGREAGSWLSKGFFDHHLKSYSKSRRKAPIYWPLGTTSGSYLVWVYAHRVTDDSLFRLLNDVVSPKLVLERRRLSELVQEAGPNPRAGQRQAIDGQEKLVDELEEFVGELTAVAPLWHPDLNDGIVVLLAPLWRLFAHHKAWSKELNKHWTSMVAGEYDWAQLAMHLWPDRVVPRCGEDRSLAIAHGLEDVFWIRDEENPDKWHSRQTPTVAVDQLVADRTDPAARAALEGGNR